MEIAKELGLRHSIVCFILPWLYHEHINSHFHFRLMRVLIEAYFLENVCPYSAAQLFLRPFPSHCLCLVSQYGYGFAANATS